MNKFALMMIATLVLSGCSVFKGTTKAPVPVTASIESSSEVSCKKEVPKVLADPSTVGRTVQWVQQIHSERFNTGFFDGPSKVSFEALLSSEAKKVQVTIMWLGQRVWDMQSTSRAVSEDRHIFIPSELKAEHLLRDIAYAYWPSAALEAQSKALRITDSKGERKVYQRCTKEPVMRIYYEEGATRLNPVGRITIRNFVEDYQLIIETAE